VEDWFANNGWTVASVIAGIIVCTSGGLLSLTPDPEKPLRFVPVYVVSLALFLCGLGMILWCNDFPAAVAEFFRETSQTG
jgi:hypothetical protein